MTALIALGPLALTPLVALLLMEFGPERSVLFTLYWLIPSIVFAVVMPILRRRGRSLQRASLYAIVWAIVITAVVVVGLFFGFTPATAATPTSQASPIVRTPGAGSMTRTAVLDAIRRRIGVKSRFKVSHIRATDRWAFVRCVEVVADGEQFQETDLDIAALLERRGTDTSARWDVVDAWALSTDDTRPYAAFARRVRERVRSAGIPSELFPHGFLTSDVPVE
jgi:hypothetical protein